MSEDARYFIGTFAHTIDSVNRLVIPAKWRTGTSEELVVVARDEGRLAVLPKPEVEKILQKIESAPDISASEKRTKRQIIFSSAEQVTCDKQGRITMIARLMAHAGLKRDVVLVGQGERFDMWNPKAWERSKSKDDPARNTTFDEYGI